MVPHNYTNASDNLAQYEADQIGRQEVTVDWYLDNMIDEPIFRWTSDCDANCGLDPWRYYMDLPIEPEDVKERGWRLFVQRSDMPADLRTEKHVPVSSFVWRDNRSEAELMDAADQRWVSQ